MDILKQHSDEKQTEKKKTIGRKTLLFLIGTAFLSSAGIGIFTPVFPFIIQRYLSKPGELAIVVGLLTTIYSFCQFIAAPGLGALSDHYGRRPLLLICLLGSAVGYTLFGLGGALWVLFLSRIIDGLTGGDMSILFATLADSCEPEERGKYFGFLGATFGIGFIIGPAIGGLAAHFGYQAPAYLVAILTTINLLWGSFFLPESLKQGHRNTSIRLADLSPVKHLGGAMSLKSLRWLFLASFLYILPVAMVQSNLIILAKDSLAWDAASMGGLFAIVGIIDIFMQGVLAGRLLPIFGETTLSALGLCCELTAFVLFGLVAVIASPIVLLAGVVIFAIGGGLFEPAQAASVSRSAPPEKQGTIAGVNQSIQALARMLGPVLGGLAYAQIGHTFPYWIGTIPFALAILAVGIIRAVRPGKKRTGIA